MGTWGKTFKGVAKGIVRDFFKAGGAVIGGMKKDNKISSNFSKIETGVKKYESPNSSIFNTLIKGSKAPPDVIMADRSRWKKPAAPTKPVSQIIDTSIFAKTKKTSLTRQQAAWYFNEDLKKKENQGLKIKLKKYNPMRPGESEMQWVKRIQDEWFGKVDEYASPYAGKVGISIEQLGDKTKIESRIKRVLSPGMRTERNSKRKEWKKLNISTLKKYTGYNKN